MGKHFLEIHTILGKNGNSFHNLDADASINKTIQLVITACVYPFRIATLGTTGGEDIEVKKYCGHVSTIMRLLTNKEGDLLSYFNKIIESQNGNKVSPLN